MKHSIIIIILTSLLLISCDAKENTAVDKLGNTVKSSFSKKITLPLNPCDYITRNMIMAHLDVDEASLELRSEEHTSELQSRPHLVCRLLLEKKKHIG